MGGEGRDRDAWASRGAAAGTVHLPVSMREGPLRPSEAREEGK